MNSVRNIEQVEVSQRALTPVIDTPQNFMGYTALDQTVRHLYRRRFFKADTVLNQSFPGYWNILKFTNYPPGKFSVITESGRESPSGSFYVYVPARNYTKWCFTKGHHEYEMFVSFSSGQDDCFPAQPLVIPFEPPHRVRGYDDIADLLYPYRVSQLCLSGRRAYVAEKTKTFLDEYFREDRSFDEIAKDVRIPYPTLVSGFKKYYGIPPIQYRNILRTFEALRLMNMGSSVTEACFNAGFTSLAQYNVHFHRNLGAAPSTFLRLTPPK